jgi:hypothetical protein
MKVNTGLANRSSSQVLFRILKGLEKTISRNFHDAYLFSFVTPPLKTHCI